MQGIPEEVVVYSEQQLKETFHRSFTHVYGNLSAEDGKEIEVMQFLTNLISNFNLYSRFTPDEMSGLTNVVFQSEIVRDFIFTFQAVFFGMWVQGRGTQILSKLAEDLARSISVDAGLAAQYQEKYPSSIKLDNYHFTPVNVKGSLASYEEIVRLLHANPWAICLLLFHQYLNIDVLEKITAAVRVAGKNK